MTTLRAFIVNHWRLDTDAEVWVGWDSRERLAYQVAVNSLLAHSDYPPPVRPISNRHPLYKRPTERKNGRLWDGISQAYCSTEFSLSRFLVPLVSKAQWALFCDGDFMFRADIADLFSQANPRYACQVVKHEYKPGNVLKMDSQVQTSYPRKLWSSLTLWNMGHAANRGRFTLEMLHKLKGLELHQFAWLRDSEIGELDGDWNALPSDEYDNPRAVHLTEGTPDMVEVPRWGKEWWSYTTNRKQPLSA